MSKKQQELPKDVSITQLRWLLGDLSAARISQLEHEGIIERSARGRYLLSSVPAVVKQMRERGEGPKEWSDARTDAMRERALRARNERLEHERALTPTNEILPALLLWVGAAHAKLLGVPNKFGSMFGQVSHSMLAAVELLKRLQYEALSEFAATPVLNAADEATYRQYFKSLYPRGDLNVIDPTAGGDASHAGPNAA